MACARWCQSFISPGASGGGRKQQRRRSARRLYEPAERVPPRDLRHNLRARLREIDPGNPALETLTAPDHLPTQAEVDALSDALREAQERAGEPPDTRWQLGWSARGIEFEWERIIGERTLPPNTPIIDDFRLGVVISIKTIDLNAPSYRDPVVLSRRIDLYIDRLWGYTGTNWGNARVQENEVRGRLLDIVVPKNSATLTQRQVIAASIERARKLGIVVFISPY